MKKKGFIVAVSIVFLVGVIACDGGGKSKRKSSKAKNRGRATGYAMIYDEDTSLARDRATDRAKSKLVKKVLGETVSGTQIVQDYELVADIIESRSYGLVKNDRIIDQGTKGPKEYFVTLEGTVEVAAVQDAIESALDNYGKPKFMVLIKETFEGKLNMPGFTETEMILQEIMGNSGFDFVDAAMTQELMKRQKRKMNKAMNGRVNEDTRQLLLNDAGAEVIIIGVSQTKDQSGVLRSYGSKHMKSKSAIVKIKAIDVYTGRTLATISRNAPGVHIEKDTASKKAIEAALKQILGKKNRDTGKFETGDFIKSIVKKFVKSSTQRQINVLITGLDSAGLKDFRENVSNRVRGVSKVIPKGRVGRAAKLLVIFAGKTHDFEDELASKADKMGFDIDIKESFPNKLVIKAKVVK